MSQLPKLSNSQKGFVLRNLKTHWRSQKIFYIYVAGRVNLFERGALVAFPQKSPQSLKSISLLSVRKASHCPLAPLRAMFTANVSSWRIQETSSRFCDKRAEYCVNSSRIAYCFTNPRECLSDRRDSAV